MDGVEYEEFSSPALTPGSVLVIGTDGIWEMLDTRLEQFGKDRLRAAIRKNHAGSAAQIAVALDAELLAFRGTRAPEDDVTFVIVKLLPNVK